MSQKFQYYPKNIVMYTLAVAFFSALQLTFQSHTFHAQSRCESHSFWKFELSGLRTPLLHPSLAECISFWLSNLNGILTNEFSTLFSNCRKWSHSRNDFSDYLSNKSTTSKPKKPNKITKSHDYEVNNKQYKSYKSIINIINWHICFGPYAIHY